jgi:hypothetical protein
MLVTSFFVLSECLIDHYNEEIIQFKSTFVVLYVCLIYLMSKPSTCMFTKIFEFESTLIFINL